MYLANTTYMVLHHCFSNVMQHSSAIVVGFTKCLRLTNCYLSMERSIHLRRRIFASKPSASSFKITNDLDFFLHTYIFRGEFQVYKITKFSPLHNSRSEFLRRVRSRISITRYIFKRSTAVHTPNYICFTKRYRQFVD